MNQLVDAQTLRRIIGEKLDTEEQIFDLWYSGDLARWEAALLYSDVVGKQTTDVEFIQIFEAWRVEQGKD